VLNFSKIVNILLIIYFVKYGTQFFLGKLVAIMVDIFVTESLASVPVGNRLQELWVTVTFETGPIVAATIASFCNINQAKKRHI
jgi:hypothetical protein